MGPASAKTGGRDWVPGHIRSASALEGIVFLFGCKGRETLHPRRWGWKGKLLLYSVTA